MMIQIWAGLIAAFVAGSIIWSLFNGEWEAALVTQTEEGRHHFLLDLSTRPIWDEPTTPEREAFAVHFASGWRDFPEKGKIEVYHNWGDWIDRLIIIWFLGALVIAPVSLGLYRRDKVLGVLGRFAGSLVVSGFLCFVLWLVVGGWGPPVPYLFAFLGFGVGLIWSVVFLSDDNGNSEQGTGGNAC